MTSRMEAIPDGRRNELPVEKTIMTGSHRSVAVRVLTAFALIAAIGIAGARAAQARTAIMPMGDSITGSPGCGRALLWNNLQNTGFTRIDSVGTLPPQGCGIPYDGDNEGHGGILATDIANQNLMPGWLAATQPGVVVMHLGTHDVWSARSPDAIVAASSTLVDQMRAQSPSMQILVAQTLLMNPSNCTACGDRVIAAPSSGSGTLHPMSRDTYAATYAAGGVSFTVSEYF